MYDTYEVRTRTVKRLQYVFILVYDTYEVFVLIQQCTCLLLMELFMIHPKRRVWL